MDEGLAQGEGGAPLTTPSGETVGGAVGAEATGVSQRAGVTPIGFHAATARRVHGSEVGIGDDDVVAEILKKLRDPLAFGRSFEQEPHAWACSERKCKYSAGNSSGQKTFENSFGTLFLY